MMEDIFAKLYDMTAFSNIIADPSFLIMYAIAFILLYLGIRNIRLGPTLPAFVSPGVLNYLVENFHIAPVTTPEEDLKTLLKR